MQQTCQLQTQNVNHDKNRSLLYIQIHVNFSLEKLFESCHPLDVTHFGMYVSTT